MQRGRPDRAQPEGGGGLLALVREAGSQGAERWPCGPQGVWQAALLGGGGGVASFLSSARAEVGVGWPLTAAA